MTVPRFATRPCRTVYGHQLRAARRELGWSLRDLRDATDRIAARHCLDRGVSIQSISRYESGEQEPSLLVASLLARALGQKLQGFDPLGKMQGQI